MAWRSGAKFCDGRVQLRGAMSSKGEEMYFRGLREDEIELRVGSVNKNKTGFSLLCYKDARCDQNILDEVYTPMYWQRDHKEIKGNLYGGVGVYNKETGEWIWKWDCGVESYSESEKGEASDSFKRACFNLGIGRELYTSPFIWIKGHMGSDGKPDTRFVSSLRVSAIEYTETETKRTISKLQIKDGDGIVVFSYGTNQPTKKESKPPKNDRLTRKEMEQVLTDMCDTKRYRVSELCEKTGVSTLEEMTDEQISKWIDWLEDK